MVSALSWSVVHRVRALVLSSGDGSGNVGSVVDGVDYLGCIC